jgi:hypothetical protein
MRLILESEAVRKVVLACFSVKRSVCSPVFSIEAMSVTNGLYIGALSPAGAWKEKMTSSRVTGWPSCHFMPVRILTSTVLSSTQVTLSAAHGRGMPSGPMRITRSQIRSVTQLSTAPPI